MFGWLFPAKCPVPDDRRAWLEARLNWLGAQFGPKRLLARPVVLPTPQFFPDVYDGTPRAAELVFARVCGYMDIDPARVALGWHENGSAGVPLHLREGRSEGAAGLYYDDRYGPAPITIDAAQLADPASMIGTMAHELGHVHLLGDRRVTADTPDHEHLTDLLTVAFGLGVFTANSVIREAHWNDGQMSGWSVGKQGYLTGPEYGYAHAVLARARGEERPPAWASHLRLDVRSALKEGLRFLKAGNKNPFALEPRANAPGDDVAGERPKLSVFAPESAPTEDDVPWTRPKPATNDTDEGDNLPPWMRNR
jgi:hypothetical protein